MSTPATKLTYSAMGTNIRAAVDGNEIEIRFNHNEQHGPSSSGKTIIVATSGGNQAIPGGQGVVLGFNAYVKPGNNQKPITNGKTGWSSIGTNLRYKVEGAETVIRFDMTQRNGPSSSGKTTIVASSGGNQALNGTPGVILGFNAYVK